jgi:hypothetical protein
VDFNELGGTRRVHRVPNGIYNMVGVGMVSMRMNRCQICDPLNSSFLVVDFHRVVLHHDVVVSEVLLPGD